jgi:hypothetical protein
MDGLGKWSRMVAFLGLIGLSGVSVPAANGQTGAAGSSGLGLVPLPSSSGGTGSMNFGIIPMNVTGSTGTTGAAARALDPLGLGYVYGGAAMPMTNGQAGLSMLSASQRRLGIGNGQISGVRPAAGATNQAAAGLRGRKDRAGSDEGSKPSTATYRRDANTPGGLAAGYFSRPKGQANATHRNSYYNRPLRYFPQRGQ